MSRRRTPAWLAMGASFLAACSPPATPPVVEIPAAQPPPPPVPVSTRVCAPGAKQCSGNLPQACDDAGHWQGQAACAWPLPACAAGVCALPPSCREGGPGAGDDCGPLHESCCASPEVPGGTFNRDDDPAAPATVSAFRLDRFEITVGRFRRFVAGYPGNKPVSGAGENPKIPGSGWDPAWDLELAQDQAALRQKAVKCEQPSTWTLTAGANEGKAMSCLSWFEAFALCAWDGGRLPTEAEWTYAAAGGGDKKEGQRVYPWSRPPSSTKVDPSYAVYGGPYHHAAVEPVGSRSPKGDGRWGQADLAGNVAEWVRDSWRDRLSGPCDDCVNLVSSPLRVFLGGSWYFLEKKLGTSFRDGDLATHHSYGIGARCARQR